jgi:hypothetical protein
MLGDASVCDHGHVYGGPQFAYSFSQSDVNTNYFKFVLNIFANVVGSVSFGSVDHDQFLKHQMKFYVPEQIITDWYPDGYVLLLI